jgi:hypothetical protein
VPVDLGADPLGDLIFDDIYDERRARARSDEPETRSVQARLRRRPYRSPGGPAVYALPESHEMRSVERPSAARDLGVGPESLRPPPSASGTRTLKAGEGAGSLPGVSRRHGYWPNAVAEVPESVATPWLTQKWVTEDE